jgi:hypothetical protein
MDASLLTYSALVVTLPGSLVLVLAASWWIFRR